MIEAEKATYTIKRMCELLEVSRSGYYKWRRAREVGPSPTAARRAELDAKVAAFHKRMKGLEGTRFALPRETLAYVWAAAAHDVAWLRQIMNAEVFEETYPPEAVTGPAWDTTTLWQLAELID